MKAVKYGKAVKNLRKTSSGHVESKKYNEPVMNYY